MFAIWINLPGYLSAEIELILSRSYSIINKAFKVSGPNSTLEISQTYAHIYVPQQPGSALIPTAATYKGKKLPW